jgi:hypothetical protein
MLRAFNGTIGGRAGLSLQVSTDVEWIIDMELHLIVRLIVVVIALSMFLPRGWPALALKAQVMTR